MKSLELQQSGMNVEETDKQNCSELTELNERIENTPLMSRWEKDNGWSFGIVGYRVSKWYETKEEMLKRVEAKEWEDILGIIGVVMDATLKLNNLIK
jgi:hypothetical protein